MSNINSLWLSGNYFQRQEVLNNIYNQVKTYDQINVDGEMSLSYFLSDLLSSDIDEKFRIFVVNELPVDKKKTKTSISNAIVSSLPRINKDTLVIFNNIGDNKTIHSYVKENGKTFEYKSYIENKYCSDAIRAMLTAHDKKIDDTTLGLISSVLTSGAEKSGVLFESAYSLVLSMCEMSGDNKTIKNNIAEYACSHMRKYVVWKLFDIIDNKDYQKSVEFFNAYVNDKENIEHIVVEYIYVMIWRYRLLFLIGEMINNGMDKDTVRKNLADIYKIERSGSGRYIRTKTAIGNNGEKTKAYSEYVIKFMLDGGYGKKPTISLYSRKELISIVKALYESLYIIRSGIDDGGIKTIFLMILSISCDVNRVECLDFFSYVLNHKCFRKVKYGIS